MPADPLLLSALMEALKRDLFHRFWTFSDPAQRRTQEGSFYRNVRLLGASLALFALFSVVGAGQFALTGPLLKLGSP